MLNRKEGFLLKWKYETENDDLLGRQLAAGSKNCRGARGNSRIPNRREGIARLPGDGFARKSCDAAATGRERRAGAGLPRIAPESKAINVLRGSRPGGAHRRLNLGQWGSAGSPRSLDGRCF